jgi:predicted transcriptional regulator of viral defense system
MAIEKLSFPIVEKVLQKLLEEFPSLLSTGVTEDPKDYRWILVKREVGIPSEEGGVDRWYLDHLFLDQDGIPTLVEVKRSSNDQIRREIVGQMLDYAANAIEYWPPEIIREHYLTTCNNQGKDPVCTINNLLKLDTNENISYDEYWERVIGNLKVGRIRLIFFADRISDELKRIVKFLQAQFNLAEVWDVEIEEYISNNFNVVEKMSKNLISVRSENQGPDYDLLYTFAEGQAGYFTAAQGQDIGFSWERLSSNVKSGKFKRVKHGVYRLVHFPGSPFEDLFIAMLRTGPLSAISHESALSVYGLSDILPARVHVIIPRTASRRRKGIKLHTNRLNDDEITIYNGLRITTVARTIADVAIYGHAEEQIRQAIQEALERGLTTQEELKIQASRRGGITKQIFLDELILLSEN